MSISLSGEKIRLRAVELEDIDRIFQWENNPDIWLISSTLVPFSKASIVEYVKTASQSIYAMQQLRLIIETSEDQPIAIGAIDLFDFNAFHQRAGVGILIAEEENREKKYATEALHLLVQYAFDFLRLKQLYCTIPEGNEASIRLFQSLGFVPCGRKLQWLRIKDKWVDELTFQLINSEV